MATLQERFEAKYIPEPNSGCWLWTASVDWDGYGAFEHTRAHRFSWKFHWGWIPAGMHVLHKCDQPSCVNPDHLYLGTSADNTRDMMQKGRNSDRHGIKHHMVKLTEADVIAIRADTRPRQEIAQDYGITSSNVSVIQRRKSWRHI